MLDAARDCQEGVWMARGGGEGRWGQRQARQACGGVLGLAGRQSHAIGGLGVHGEIQADIAQSQSCPNGILLPGLGFLRQVWQPLVGAESAAKVKGRAAPHRGVVGEALGIVGDEALGQTFLGLQGMARISSCCV
jgi:hypothetical protein